MKLKSLSFAYHFLLLFLLSLSVTAQQQSPQKAESIVLLKPAAEKFFRQGLVTPEKSEYRELEIRTSGVWGGTGTIKVHGWLLREGTEKEMLAWNGLVYPVINIGEKADLRQDVLDLLKKDEELRLKFKQENPNFPLSRYSGVLPNGNSASEKTLLPIKAVLLLGLKENKLAAELITAWKAGEIFNQNNGINWNDPYFQVSYDWVWAMYDRALTEYMHGNYELALNDARQLEKLSREINEEAVKKGFKLSDFSEKTNQVFLSYLEPLPVLLRELERRNNSSKVSSVNSLDNIQRLQDKKERIKALIRKLDEVAARQWGQPGGVDLTSDEIVRSLIGQGDEAVEPLIETIETDERLTRSVSFHRNFFPGRHLITVAEAALSALSEILANDSYRINGRSKLTTSEGRKKLADQIRSDISRYGKGSDPERWFRILADDQADQEQWNEAAANIISPLIYSGSPPPWVFLGSPAMPTNQPQNFPRKGDALRAKTAPSIADLFRRRLRETKRISFALALLAWDGLKEIEEARTSQEKLRTELDSIPANDNNRQSSLRSKIMMLYLKRMQVRDKSAFADYAGWMKTLTPEQAGENTKFLFQAMWEYPSEPEIEALAEELFNRQNSKWLPLIEANNKESFNRAELSLTLLINQKSFRAKVLEILRDQTVVGVLRRRKDLPEKYEMKVENTYTAFLLGAKNAAGISGFEIPGEKGIDTGSESQSDNIQIRACDVFASRLRLWKGTPKFEYYWSKEEKDRAIGELIDLLEKTDKFSSPF